VEVKSGAFLQSWYQERPSSILFKVSKTHALNPDTNKMSAVAQRQADVYVFALLTHQEKSTLDPLNLAQWQFYVLPTKVLNDRKRSQHSITLKSLQALANRALDYAGLDLAVKKAAKFS